MRALRPRHVACSHALRATENGRNLTIARYPQFMRLVQVGLPNRLRGEIWEVTSGSIHLRLGNPGEYERLLEQYRGKSSLSLEEIEKDLNRSMPGPLLAALFQTCSLTQSDPRVPCVSESGRHRHASPGPDCLFLEEPYVGLLSSHERAQTPP